MIVLYNKEDARKWKFSRLDSIEWQCGHCGKIHTDIYRNIFRRAQICNCLKLQKQIEDYNEKLSKLNFYFLHEETTEYNLTKNGLIDRTKTLLPIKCLDCGKVFKAYLGNVLTGHKKCDCNKSKVFVTDLTPEQYVEKWTKLNQEKFSILSEKYEGRTRQYKIKCKKCGTEDLRYGITLQGTDIKCKTCELRSAGERKVASFLDKYGVKYYEQYRVKINDNLRIFDFYCYEQNLMIEYHGQQHYKAIEYFGGEERFLRQQERDKEKKEYCLKNDIRFLEIPFSMSEEEIENIIKHSIKFNDQSKDVDCKLLTIEMES